MEFWKKKMGPLPNWAWGALGLGAAVAYSSWQKNKADGEKADPTSTSGINMPESIQPTYVFQDSDTTNITWPDRPAGGGRPPVTTLPAPAPSTGYKPPAVPPPPRTPAPPASPTGKYVTVTKFTTKNPPWNSTIWGITTKLLGPKAQWQAVWNAPQNAALKTKRKDPTKIQPGDKVWVPGAK